MDDSDLDFMGVLARVTPQGPGAEDDTALIATGVVRGIDVAKRRLTVRVRGGIVTLPAPAGRYVAGGLVRVLMDATVGRPSHVLGPVDVRAPSALATVTGGPTAGILTVSYEGSSYALPSPVGAYTVGAAAWLLLDDWGVPVYVLGPSSTAAPGVNPGAGGGGGSAVVSATSTIGPQSTGTWRSGYGWDTWGNDIYGGVADIYQGSGYGSGALTGLACYGDQIVNLGAIAIQSARLSVLRNGSGEGASALTVQGSPHGSRPGGAPSASGSTASTAAVKTNLWAAVDLPADICEALRTGAAKALAAVGGAYAGFGGTSTPGSFTLAIQYTRNA